MVDAVSGVDLTDVIVIKSDHWFEDDAIHPGTWDPDDVLAEGATSPFEAEPPDHGFMINHAIRVLVGAPNRQWAVAHLEFSVGGEHRVLLSAGATLEILLHGELPSGSERPRDRGEDDGQPQIRLRQITDSQDLPSLEQILQQVAEADDSEFPGGIRPSEEEVRGFLEEALGDRARTRGPVLVFDPARKD